MKPKTTRILYWTVTIIFALAMLADGIGGVTRQQAGVDALQHLGYPVYALTIFGIAKILGSLAILQTKFSVIKEWAYAGFTINFIGAMMSTAMTGDGIGHVMMPLAPMAVMFFSYFLWKRMEQIKRSPAPSFA